MRYKSNLPLTNPLHNSASFSTVDLKRTFLSIQQRIDYGNMALTSDCLFDIVSFEDPRNMIGSGTGHFKVMRKWQFHHSEQQAYTEISLRTRNLEVVDCHRRDRIQRRSHTQRRSLGNKYEGGQCASRMGYKNGYWSDLSQDHFDILDMFPCSGV